MAKKITWSLKAKRDQLDILEYWYHRNKSTVYPRKLRKLFSDAIDKISKEPIPRRSTEIDDVYVIIVRDYKIFFKDNEDTIFVITVWDTRQESTKLEKILKN